MLKKETIPDRLTPKFSSDSKIDEWVRKFLNLGLRRAFKLQNMIHRKRVPEEWESSSSLSSLEAETAADALVEALPVPAYTVLFEPT